MGSCSIWGAPMSRSRSAGIASSWVRCRPRWPSCDGVGQAVVIAREDRPGDKRLVGYVTGTADPAEIRAALAERLPAYMVPAAVVVIDALPLTVNGKLDTRALPAPEYRDVDRYRAPANAVEEILAGIYAQVLGLERVGVDDSFFDLGGDSLSAMRLIAAINTGLDAGVGVRALFEAPTVAQLAPRIGGAGGWAGAVGGGGAARGGAVVVCPVPVVVYRAVAGAVTGLQHGGGVAAERCGWMPRRWGRRWPMWWAARRACARCSRRSRGSRSSWWCRVERADFGWQVVDATGWPADRLEEAIGAAARHPFDLAAEIPLRARLFRVAEDEHVLVAVVHHIAADGWSITPLVR